MKGKEKNNSITIIYKKEIDDSELDMTLYENILGKNWSEREDKDGRHGVIRKGEKQYGWQGESHAISIERMINHLNSLKKKGCNYVEIVYHTDHIGYNIYGIDIHRSTDEEIAEYKENINRAKDKQKAERIKELEAELEKIKHI